MKMLLTKRNPLSLSTELRSLGVPQSQVNSDYSADTFPSILKPEYKESWEAFIKTPLCKSFAALGSNKMESNFFVCSAFVSHVLNIDTQPFIQGKLYIPVDVTFKRLDHTLGQLKPAFKEWSLRKGMQRKLGIDNLEVDVVDKKYDKLTNSYYDLKVTVNIVLKPYKKYVLSRSQIGSKLIDNHLDAVLNDLRNYLFKGEPKQLFGAKRNLGGRKTKTRYVDPNIVRNSPDRLLHLVDKSLGVPVYMHRTGPYSMLMRFSFDVPNILFLGSASFDVVEKYLQDKMKKVIKLT